MTRVVTKRGHSDWDDLIGKEISFEYFDGWEDLSYWGVLEGIQVYAEDPRYPRYYVLTDGGGVSYWEDEEVEVTVYE